MVSPLTIQRNASRAQSEGPRSKRILGVERGPGHYRGRDPVEPRPWRILHALAGGSCISYRGGARGDFHTTPCSIKMNTHRPYSVSISLLSLKYRELFLHACDLRLGNGEWPQPPEVYRKMCAARAVAEVLERFKPEDPERAFVNLAELYDTDVLVNERRLAPLYHAPVEDLSE
jgi:hypothetical protein